MPKEILLYSSIYSYTAESFIRDMDEYINDDVVLRINSAGGDPRESFGMIAKIQEHPKSFKIKVDNAANSMGAFLLCYSNDVECLNISTFLLHRAAFTYESDLSEENIKEINIVNAELKRALLAKIDAAKFEEISGVSVDALFSMDTRINVTLNAEQAEKIGLVDKVVALSGKDMEALSKKYMKMAAHQAIEVKEPKKEQKSNPINNKKMTLQEFKSSHPEIFAEARQEGVLAERDRVGSFLAYADADMEAVKKGIKEGETLSLTAQSELNIKMLAKKEVGSAEVDSAGSLDTKKEEKELNAVEEFEKKFDESRKLKTV